MDRYRAKDLSLSGRGVEFIKDREAFVGHLYNDQAGHCTVGYGHLVHYGPIDGRTEEAPFLAGITEPAAAALLVSDARAKAEHFVRIYVSAPITQNQYDALVSFTFNLGGSALWTSTLLKKLNAGDELGAADQFGRWVYADGQPSDGLKQRRALEKALFLEGLA